jgi:hypothetical protein
VQSSPTVIDLLGRRLEGAEDFNEPNKVAQSTYRDRAGAPVSSLQRWKATNCVWDVRAEKLVSTLLHRPAGGEVAAGAVLLFVPLGKANSRAEAETQPDLGLTTVYWTTWSWLLQSKQPQKHTGRRKKGAMPSCCDGQSETPHSQPAVPLSFLRRADCHLVC